MASEKPIDITECDKEPVHLLGKIQSHGVLFAFHKFNHQLYALQVLMQLTYLIKTR